MRKFWSKNALIAVLLLTNAATGAFLIVKKTDFLNWFFGPTPAAASARVEPPAKASVDGPLFSNNDLKGCYESLLAREPQVDEGMVHMHMKFTSKGEVNFLEMKHSDFEDSVFTECVTDTIKNKRLPASLASAGQIISHKFKFRRKHVEQVDYEQ